MTLCDLTKVYRENIYISWSCKIDIKERQKQHIFSSVVVSRVHVYDDDERDEYEKEKPVKCSRKKEI